MSRGTEIMAEKKVNTIKRTPSAAVKQQDQMLGSGVQVYGKIESPVKAQQSAKKTEPKAAPAQRPAPAKAEAPKAAQSIQAPKPAAEIKQAAPQKSGEQAKRPSRPRTQNRRPKAAEPKTEAKPQSAPAAVPAAAAAQPTEILSLPNKNRRTSQSRGKRSSKKTGNKPSIKAYFLGGLNEIGKNFTVYECGNDMVIVDCGLAFPDDDMLGIDVVIPDFTFVEKNADKIRGIIITHGHEDHIGALPYLLKKFKFPLYGTPLTLGLIGGKFKEHGLTGMVKMNVCHAGDHIKLGCFDCELVHVNHSISDAVAIALHTPAGVIVHTGDFKIDCTPTEGGMIDLARFAELGKEGVLCLLADSTNAERPGYTPTEQKVNAALDSLFARAGKKRVIVATFASSISRVQQIINCAIKYKRKVALSGRSMLNVMAVATELGYLHVPEGLLVDLSVINRYTSDQIVLITTGSQGEPMSALTRMAFSEHRQVEVGSNDFIIISARPIPGNEKTVGAVVDELLKRGCEVIYESMYEVHVSGHACQEELKLMQALTKPKYFIPVHGEQKHLRKHASLSMAMGMPEKNIYIGDVGKSVEINEDFLKEGPDVPAGEVMVDGLGVGDVGSIVMRDRKHLGEDGLIIAVCAIDPSTGRIVSGPDIVSRGFVYVRESEEMMDRARKIVYQAVEACADEGVHEWSAIKTRVRDNLSRFFFEKTRRSPMILPIVMEV